MGSSLVKDGSNRVTIKSTRDGVGFDSSANEYFGGSGTSRTGDLRNDEVLNSLSNTEEELGSPRGLYKSGDSIDEVRDGEEKASGLFSGSGRIITKNKRGLFLKKTPAGIIGIIVAIFGLGTLSFTTMIPEIVAWKENIMSLFGQNSAVMNVRSNYVMARLLSNNSGKLKMSKSLSNRLKKYNINYVDANDLDGKSLKMFVYEDSNGKMIPIVASESDVRRVNAMVDAGADIDIDGRSIKLTDTGLTLSAARRTNRQFSVDYDTATISFTGKIAGWFDDMTDAMLKRTVGDNARKQTDIDDPTKEKVDEMLLKNRSSGVDDSSLRVSDGEAEDENGNKVLKTGDVDVNEVVGDNGKTYGDIAAENGKINTDSPSPESVTKGLSAKAQKAAMLSSTVACGFLKSIGSISSAVGAMMSINLVNYASKYLEIADKIKAGDADEVTNIAMNNLNESVKTMAYDLNGEEVPDSGAVTNSPGFNTVFSSVNLVDENNPSALYSNREYANRNALNSMLQQKGDFSELAATILSIGSGVEVYRACNVVQGVAGAIDGITDVASIFTFGLAGGIKEIITGALKGAALAGSIGLITTVIAAITPMVASWFNSQLSNAFLGMNGGYALLSGAQSILNSNLQMSTGRYADKNNAVRLFGLTKNVEQDWAAYERATLSPFDVTSQYTFFGSIYNSMIPVISKMNNGAIVSTISSVANLTKTSAIASLNPSANAANEIKNYAVSLAGENNCSSLKSVGVAGDFSCNKYTGAYIEELTSIDQDENYQKMVEYDSFDGVDSYGNPKIKNGSDYAKYIIACVASDAQPGTMNASVEGYIEGIQKDIAGIAGGGPVANGLVNFGSNFIPFEGFLDVIDAAEQADNYKWNSGYACTGNTDDSRVNEMVKNFSIYNLDQRVLNDMGLIESNSTVAFLKDYYNEYPMDYSFEGQIARVSGMTKEEVSDTLALIEYYDYIANYNPDERYAFGDFAIEGGKIVKFDDSDEFVEKVILLSGIQFADVRNRSFAV